MSRVVRAYSPAGGATRQCLRRALAAHLRPRTGHRVPIVALTAWPDHPLLDTGEVAAVLMLPFELDELLTLAAHFGSQARRGGRQSG